MLQGARELNVNQDLLTNAYMGQGDALGQLNHQLDAIMSPYKDYNDMVAHANPEEQKRWMLANLMKDTLNKQGGEFGTAAQKAADLANAQGSAALSAGKLAAEFGTLSDKEGSAADKMSALMKIMDTFAGRQPDVEQATEQWEKFVDGFNKKDMNFEDKKAGTKNYVQSLIDASGQINLTTADGRKLYDTVREGEKDFDQTAMSMKNSGASMDEIRAKLEPMRKSFIDNAMSMGFTQQQAEMLANKYGLIPGQVATIVSSNLSPELQKAIELGGTIRALPDGSFVVDANTGSAQGKITKLIQDNNGRVITIHVNTVTGAQLNVSNGSFSRIQATGGPTRGHAAEGGARTGPITVNERGRQEGFTTPGGDTFLLPMGGQVVPNANIQAMADQQHFRRAGAGGGAVVQWIGGPTDDLGAAVWRYFQRNVRIYGGGDVQSALGQAGQAA
jgi:chromosome segregation ATPase